MSEKFVQKTLEEQIGNINNRGHRIIRLTGGSGITKLAKNESTLGTKQNSLG